MEHHGGTEAHGRRRLSLDTIPQNRHWLPDHARPVQVSTRYYVPGIKSDMITRPQHVIVLLMLFIERYCVGV